MLNIHKVPNCISHFHKAYRQSIICILPIVRSLLDHRQGLLAFAHSANMLPVQHTTPNQRFLNSYMHPSATASPVGSGAPKPAKSSSHRRKVHKETTPSKGGLPKMNCDEYWPLARVEEGIKDGTVLTGSFRINQRNYTTAYITAADGQRDIVIEGIDRRNRAMHGDIVAVELVNENDAVRKEVDMLYIILFSFCSNQFYIMLYILLIFIMLILIYV